ncbi:MAG: BT4734/BF3469 family protein [Flavonifractor plautii]
MEKYHRMMYDTCKEYYEKLLDVEVDGSGKDISRGFFTSFDEKAYLNEELMKEVDEILTGIFGAAETADGEKEEWEGDE